MENLVRIRVADAREEAGIGQRPLHRVILARQACGERGEVDVQHFEPAGIERRQRRFVGEVVQRCPALGAGFGERERAVLELERRQRDPRGRRFAGGELTQPAGDHQVQHEEAYTLQREHDPLAEPPEADHAPAFGLA